MNGLWKLNEGKYISENLVKEDGSHVAALTNSDLKVTLVLNGAQTVIASGSRSLVAINSASYLLTITSGLVNAVGDALLVVEAQPTVSAARQFQPVALNFRCESNDLDSVVLALNASIAAVSGSLGSLMHTVSAAVTATPGRVWTDPVRQITGMTLSAVKDIFDTNTSQFTAVNSLGKRLVDNINAVLSGILAKTVSGLAGINGVKGVGFTATDSLVAIKAAVASIPTTSLTYANIASAVLNAPAASYQLTGSIGEVLRFVKCYTTGRRFYNSGSGLEEMYDGVSTLVKQFEITLDSDDRLVDRSPI